MITDSGGTGKTTLLNMLADFIPDEDRLVVIEDTAEIHIRKANLVRCTLFYCAIAIAERQPQFDRRAQRRGDRCLQLLLVRDIESKCATFHRLPILVEHLQCGHIICIGQQKCRRDDKAYF
jgi:energy-coupling factor transporter ATP-binding protein EcfA2